MKTYPNEDVPSDYIQVRTRLDKLNIFMKSKEYVYLSHKYKAVLKEQAEGMRIYLSALDKRIDLDKPIKFKL